MKNKFIWIVVAFVALVALLGVGLTLDPRDVPSPLINRPAPDFTLNRIGAPNETFSPADYRGKVWLLNVWASWCVSCRQEHPVLVAFAKTGKVPVVGLNYKEVRGDGELDASKLKPEEEATLAQTRAQRWLSNQGNPYILSVLDLDGRVGINYGVYGVPETYLIDQQGMIRFKQTGPITPDVLEKKILPLIAELSK